MKKFLIRSTVFLLTFVVTLMVASRLLNKDRDNLTMEMGRATLPVITMLWNGMEYNPIYGCTSSVNPAFLRDQITILGENRKASFKIRTYGRNVTGIGAQVRSGDGARLIETIVIDQYDVQNEEIQAELALKDLIEPGQEYVISIELEMDGWQQAWYHARAVWDAESLVGEQLKFVADFHEKLYHREEAKALVKYLESNSKLESNTSFHKVNIHSSFKQITWGDLKVSEIRKPTFTLKEINGQNASVVVNFAVSTKGNERDAKYRAEELYKIKYSPDRTYLLGYERTMTQIPDEKAMYGGDKLLLGIGDENVAMMENESGSVVAFLQADRLFSYQVGSQKLALIFSFYDVDEEDAREEHDEHDVKILGVDEDGNVDFAVWGYQNRGEHEGEIGIRICRYNANFNTVSETAFIPWDRPYSDLKAQVKELLYLNRDQILYLHLEHGIYRVNLAEKSYERLFELQADNCLFTSADHRILAWQELRAGEYSNEIKVRDLMTEEEATLKGESKEALRILGFMGNDVIYGVARREQVTNLTASVEFFPMYKLCIARADGSVLKEYRQEDVYVTGCRIEDKQIILERMMQKEDGSFAETTQDHVTKTQQEKAGKNQISVVEIDTYERYVQIKVNGKIDSKKVQLLTPKEVLQEEAGDMAIEVSIPGEFYAVYGPMGMEKSFLSVSDAVLCADEISGIVVDAGGNLIWRKNDRSQRNQIMAIHEPEKVSVEESMAACLDAMMRQKGISADSASLLTIGRKPADILKESMNDVAVLDLTGNSLETVLFYVSRDLPVLALLKNGEGVLLTGYNESQVVVFQPSAGKLQKRSFADAAKWFEESGNGFITFFP